MVDAEFKASRKMVGEERIAIIYRLGYFLGSIVQSLSEGYRRATLGYHR